METKRIIKDPLMAPYYIICESDHYQLVTDRPPAKTGIHKGEVFQEIHGYFSNFGILLKRLVQVKVSTGGVVTIREYIDRFTEFSRALIAIGDLGEILTKEGK